MFPRQEGTRARGLRRKACLSDLPPCASIWGFAPGYRLQPGPAILSSVRLSLSKWTFERTPMPGAEGEPLKVYESAKSRGTWPFVAIGHAPVKPPSSQAMLYTAGANPPPFCGTAPWTDGSAATRTTTKKNRPQDVALPAALRLRNGAKRRSTCSIRAGLQHVLCMKPRWCCPSWSGLGDCGRRSGRGSRYRARLGYCEEIKPAPPIVAAA